MAKAHRQFVCSSCGGVHPRWGGKCPDCGEWNTLNERVVESSGPDLHRPTLVADSPAAPIPLDEIEPDSTTRWSTGFSEFDRVLGGGLVAGSAVLLGGEPGVGKSTLALQTARVLAGRGHRVMYVTSEESPGQVRLRSERLKIDITDADDATLVNPDDDEATSQSARTGGTSTRAAARSKSGGRKAKPEFADSESVLVTAQANLDIILNQIRQNRPDVIVVDSIQMVYRPDLPSVPGSATQLRDCASRLVWQAKQMNYALILVGHVTKEGAIAGPKVLEHIVDCVIYFEGERFHSHRLIRAAKNRFGSTDELGIFEMTDAGLRPVDDPSRLFLDDLDTSRPGSVILSACEGTRVLMVEVQALCVQSVLGSAKRKSTGVDPARLAMVLAVIEKHARLAIADQDVFVNIVGGVRVAEPAADLAIALAVVGALTDKSLPRGTSAFGELGLGGEIRPVMRTPRRLAESARIGLSAMVMPAARRGGGAASGAPRGLELHACGTLAHAIEQLR